MFSNHASFNFDLSTFDLFGAVAVGAALWVVPDGQRAQRRRARRRHRAPYGITVWYSVPSVARAAGSSPGKFTGSEMLAPIRYLLFAGEVFPIKQLRRLREVLAADGAALQPVRPDGDERLHVPPGSA